MIIINADDWGRSRVDTDAILRCYAEKRITSASAMVFMEDSERAADIAREAGMDAGLHLNFNEEFTGNINSPFLREYVIQTKGFLNANRYSVILYNPFLKRKFLSLYQAQAEEFSRLYGVPPSHIDGHQHMHLCANVLLDSIIPLGKRVRRSLSFWPGEKNFFNRTYRHFVDRWLAHRYRTTDYFFDLSHILQGDLRSRIVELEKTGIIELMTHPRHASEYDYLLSDDCRETLKNLNTASYSTL